MESPLRLFLRWLRLRYRGLMSRVAFAVRYLEAQFLRRHTWVVQRWQGHGALATANRIAIFVHYDRHGQVADYVRYYLEQLATAGYGILFVTNSPKLTSTALADLQCRCDLILRRRNVGYDFGAYRDALHEIPDLGKLDSLILANDSVYGPFHPLAELLAQTDPQQADIWGINDSYDRYYHLQSYFLVLHRPALTNARLRAFWDQILYVRSKGFVVHFYEVGFSRAALQAGLRLKALCPYRELTAASIEALRRLPLATPEERAKLFHGDYLRIIHDQLVTGIPVNPSHLFWDQMLIRYRCPFLKRELLTLNPAAIPGVNEWEQVIHRLSAYDTSMIERHLQQVLRHRSV